MKLSEVPQEYKIFLLRTSKGTVHVVTGEQIDMILKSKESFIRFPNGEGINRFFIVDWTLDTEATRENVQKNKPKLLE